MSTAPAYQEVVQLNHSGQYEKSLALLDALPETGIHLWLRGWALHHLGRWEEAHNALESARLQLTGGNLGRMLMDWAVLFGHERRFARAYDLHVRAWQLLQRDEVMRPLVLYNLGWQHLSRLHLELARPQLFQAMEAGEQAAGAGALERVVTRVGVSTLERLSGHPELAVDRAVWAQEVAGSHRQAHLPWRAQAQAHRHLGQLDRARELQVEAVERAPEGRYRATERLMLGLIDRTLNRAVNLEVLKAGALPLDGIRVDLHLADDLRRAGRSKDALVRLRAVLALDEPYPVRDEAPSLEALYALGREAGLMVPEWQPEGTGHDVTLRALGAPGLWLGEQEVPVTSLKAFALLVYVAMYGQTNLDALSKDVFPGVTGPQVRSRVRSALGVIARWLGDPNVIRLQGHLVVVASGWSWKVDASDVLAERTHGRGAFLPGFFSDWTGRVQALLDAQARGRS